MPQTPHTERHFTAGEAVRDVVIGMSDGLTVPFALTAEFSGAVGSTHIVVTAGLAREGLVRVGCACYTTEEEIERLVKGVRAIGAAG
jgi:selenocysteine lyase/cysteine desulfurase